MITKQKLKMKILFVAFTTISLILSSCKDSGGIENKSAADIPVSREMTSELTSPPNVPRPIGRRKAKKLIVNMEILEKEGTMIDGTNYVYWTFGGSVPESFIRTRVGDEVEFTLSNHP